MIIDMHCHFVPPEYFALAKARPEFEVAEVGRRGLDVDIRVRGAPFELNTTFFEPERQIDRLRRLGIDRTVVSLATPLINYHTAPALAVEAARVCNDGFARLVKAHPDRFSAWAFLPMQDPLAAAAELTRCVREHGFVGGHVATNVHGAYLPDERYAAVCEAAVALDVPLFIHPADPAGRDRTGDYELTVIAGYMFDTTINIFRMMCSGFLDRYPTLKLVCAHTGGYSLMLRGRMQCELDTHPDTKAVRTRTVAQYLEQLYYDTAGFEPGYMAFAASVVPPDRLLFGTDAPFKLVLDDPIEFMRQGLPGAAADAALGANFLKLTERRS